jgi:hypothetical protein
MILADITTQELSSSSCSAVGAHEAATPAVGGVAVLAGAMLLTLERVWRIVHATQELPSSFCSAAGAHDAAAPALAIELRYVSN